MTQPDIIGVLLAGGQARRMGGGDKCLLPLGGRTLLQRSIDRADPQVDQLLLNANGNVLRFARTGLPVVPDEFTGFPGPLAGIHAALSWQQQNRPDAGWLASFASDTPFFPRDCVARLLAAAEKADPQTRLVVACSRNAIHPVFALWHPDLLEDIAQTLSGDRIPRLQDWMGARRPVEVTFEADAYDPFHNINTPQDLYTAEDLLPQIDA